MSWLRRLGTTELEVSAIGLGTVKLGRDQGVRYPNSFSIPDDRAARALLSQAHDLGINLLDTAPAYGTSEERLGSLLVGQRQRWIICSKVGEEFEQGRSRFDFSPAHVRHSVERSLQRLRTDVIDIVLVHSDGDDLRIIHELGTLDALAELKAQGMIRSFGMSTKSVDGGLEAARRCDAVMLTYNLSEREDAAVLDECLRLKRGALIKKALASGHLAADIADPLAATMQLVFGHPGTTAAIIGTITPAHLAANVKAARTVLDIEVAP
jgi:aryl-alcohol dehydrogenase-like predicted oxidoreductase